MNIYVGNLSPKTFKWQLRRMFRRYGAVGNISMHKRPSEGNPYNFCFVEMPIDDQAFHAIKELYGKKLGGYLLTIKESGVSI
ncbi:MAG: RNA-binding protein [Planctomycetota bacterium]